MWATLEDGLACNLAGVRISPSQIADSATVCSTTSQSPSGSARDPSGAADFVIDTDAHQGNGSNSIFAGDERVFTYSINVGRNYPAEKTASSLDVELPRFVSGAEYLARLNATLPAALEQFAPELAFWIAGSDPHETTGSVR